MARTFLKDGRTWSINSDGINNLKRTYVLQLDTNNLGENAEIEDFGALGIPPIGSSHPFYSYLKVLSYDVEEGEGSEKKLIKVTANYGLDSSEGGSNDSDDDAMSNDVIEQWGWESGTDQKEVIYNLWDQREGALLNSAGEPFETVPVCEYPAPIFVKVLKTKIRKNWIEYSCKINQNTCVIGSMNCAPKTLIANVSEQRIFGDPIYKYRYTIQLRYKSNFSNLGAGTTPIEFGWDIPVVDAGLRQLDENNKLILITQMDSESNVPCPITSPELLDGEGKAIIRKEGLTVRPYIIRVQAYKEATFPTQFYSEPIDE